jgi:hypothetical protein
MQKWVWIHPEKQIENENAHKNGSRPGPDPRIQNNVSEWLWIWILESGYVNCMQNPFFA